MPDRPCPDCAGALAAAHLGPVALGLCFGCAAVWFARDELPRAVQAGPQVLRRLCERVRASAEAPPSQFTGALSCPDCRAPLSAVRFASLPGVRLPSCPRCGGFWVDCDTLARIAEAMD